MSAYKQFTTKDIVITPFSTNKGFSFTGNAMTASDVGVEIYFGTQPPANKLIYPLTDNYVWNNVLSSAILYPSSSQNFTGFVNKLNTNSVYSSIMQLYYSNYFGSMSGSLVATSSLLYGLEGPVQNNPLTNNQSNNIPIGAIKSPQYDNYLSSTITQTRAALLGEAVDWYGAGINKNFITAISIPSKLWGKNIEPQSFYFEYNNTIDVERYKVKDDGNGNLRYTTFDNIMGEYNQFCGNIIYEHGIAILTPVSESDPTISNTFPSYIAQAGAIALLNQNGYEPSPGYDPHINYFTVGWSSSVTLYEHQYKCVVRENEFGYSLNPSLLSGSQLTQPLPGTNYVYKDFATGSYFSPYITTIGLYDDKQNLLAIGKLSSPTKVPMKADLEIQVSFDSL
jgi:hypothetical protein